MHNRVSCLIETYGGEYHPYHHYPKVENRKAWHSLDKTLRNELIQNGEKHIGYEHSQLTAQMYMRYKTDGNRDEYQKAYFSRREVLHALVLAECAEYKGRFVQDIINVIYLICEETTWTIPAHNTHVRDQEGPILGDPEKPVLDLFSCETASNLAVAIYLVEDVLDKVSPLIRKRVQDQIEGRIVQPYLKDYFWWMGKEDEPTNNWTIWCTQSVLLAVFLMSDQHPKAKSIVEKASKSIGYFLMEYGEDGCCDEGPGYYSRAGLCLMTTLELLNHLTDHTLDELWTTTKIYNIADYIRNVHVGGSYFVNFADSSVIAGDAGSREFLFGKYTHNPKLMDFAVVSRFEGNYPKTQPPNLYEDLTDIWTYADMKMLLNTSITVHEDVWFKSVGIGVSRDRKFCISVKAGDNGDNHNHNDVGSFNVFYKDRPFIIDIGVETYTAKTFSKDRYEIWTMQSDFHNLPTVNGFSQLPGEQFCAKDVQVNQNENRFDVSMDLKNAYPDETGLKYYIRKIEFVKENDLIIEDRWAWDKEEGEVISNLIFQDKPIVEDQRLLFDQGLSVQWIGNLDSVVVEELPIVDEKLKKAWKSPIYRVRFVSLDKSLKFHINSTNKETGGSHE